MTTSRVTHSISQFAVDSPVGVIELSGDDEHLTGLRIGPNCTDSKRCAPAAPLAASAAPAPAAASAPTDVLELAAAQLDDYFNHRLRRFTVPVRLNGSAFQLAIWRRLSLVSWSSTIGYADLGREAGWPTAARAVGGAVRSNPIPIIIGCHRVLSATGKPTGYSHGSGLATKLWLLDHERRECHEHHDYDSAPSSSTAPAN